MERGERSVREEQERTEATEKHSSSKQGKPTYDNAAHATPNWFR